MKKIPNSMLMRHLLSSGWRWPFWMEWNGNFVPFEGNLLGWGKIRDFIITHRDRSRSFFRILKCI